MFARVTMTKVSPDATDKAVRYFREQTLPAMKKLAGFRGNYVLVDRKGGKGINISLWDSEKDMRASDEAADRLRGQTATGTGAQVLSVERYEVALAPEPVGAAAKP